MGQCGSGHTATQTKGGPGALKEQVKKGADGPVSPLPAHQAPNCVRKWEFTNPAIATQYMSVGEAAALTEGMRVSHIQGMPMFWSLAAINMLRVRQIPCAYVQHPIEEMFSGVPGIQDELYELTRQKSAPVLWWKAERPRSTFAEQVLLIERVARELGLESPSLVPTDRELRIRMFGLLQEITEGEGGFAGPEGIGGFAYNWRFLCAGALRVRFLAKGAGAEAQMPAEKVNFCQKYGWPAEVDESHKKESEKRVVEFLKYIDATLEAQEAAGSMFLVGNAISAVDIIFASLVSAANCPGGTVKRETPEPGDIVTNAGDGSLLLMSLWDAGLTEVMHAVTKRILAHRNRIFFDHAGAPIDIGGNPSS